MLSMRENWLLVGWTCMDIWLLVDWACAEIGYSLAEHAQKLVTRCLSIWRNLFLFVLNHVFSPVIHSPVPFSHPLSNVLCLLFQVSVSCLPSSVPCLTSLFCVFRPLFTVSRLCSLSPILCSLSPILCSQSYVSFPCLPFSFHHLKSLFLVSHPSF